MFRLLVAGGRDFYDYKYIEEVLTNWFINDFPEDPSSREESEITLVHGDSAGVDRIAAAWAAYNGLLIEPHPAKWESLGRQAGIIRNKEMIQSGINYAILFPGSKGTLNMERQLIAANISFLHAIP